jgi:hypothetical protein
VKNWFQRFAFNFNLYRYAQGGCGQMEVTKESGPLTVTLMGDDGGDVLEEREEGEPHEEEAGNGHDGNGNGGGGGRWFDGFFGGGGDGGGRGSLVDVDGGGGGNAGAAPAAEALKRAHFPHAKTYADQRLVYSWDGIDAGGVRAVRVELPGKNRQLALTEIKVFALHPDPDHVPERCAQDQDVYGDDCATDLRVDWVHLPQGTRGAKSLWDAELFESLLENIEQSQAIVGGSGEGGGGGGGGGSSAARCKSPYVESVNVGMGGKGAGLASTVHFISGLLTEGYVKGKPFVYGGRLNYATNSHCAAKGLSGDFECYVRPFSGCQAAKKTAFTKWRAPYSRNNRCAIGRLCNDLSQFKMLPKGPFGKKGLFWFRRGCTSC